jgi:hypothetical protein
VVRSDASGFAGLVRTFTGDAAGRAWVSLLEVLFLVMCGLVIWWWKLRQIP